MKKVNIIWNYQVNSNEGTWENSKTPDYLFYIDNSSRINNITNSKNVLVLYEPNSILPDNYSYLDTNKDRIDFAFTHRLDICDGKKVIHMPPFFPSWISGDHAKIYEKNKLVSMIASDKIMCKGHEYRQEIANSFPYHDDLFGRGRNFIENKIDGLRDYMFSVAMENEVSDIYYTEKILDCFLTGTIPIYWGTRRINEIFNGDGIIFLDDVNISDLSPDLYYSKMDSVIDNFKIAKELKSTSNDMVDYIIKKIS